MLSKFKSIKIIARFLIIAGLELSTLLTAQQTLTQVSLSSTKLTAVQGCNLGDSIFLSFKLPKGEYRTLLVNPDGAVQNISLLGILDRKIIGMTENTDSVFINFIEDEKKKYSVKAFSMSKITGKKALLKQSYPIEGKLISWFNEEGKFFIATINPKDSSLRFTELSRLSAVRSFRYKIPKSLIDIDGSSIAFIQEGKYISPRQAQTPIKIYLTPTEIIFWQDFLSDPVDAGEAGTRVTRINRQDGKIEKKFFRESSTSFFSSFYSNGDLYRVRKNNGMEISIFNWEGLPRTNYRVDKTSSFISEKSYFRNQEAVLNNRNVWDAISNMGRPFITVYTIDSGQSILKVGTHAHATTGRPIYAPGGPLVATIALAAASMAISSMSLSADDPGVNHYFYLQRNPDGLIEFTKNAGLIDNALDNYELMDQKKPIHYSFMRYLSTHHSLLGCYVKENSATLEFVKFPNSLNQR